MFYVRLLVNIFFCTKLHNCFGIGNYFTVLSLKIFCAGFYVAVYCPGCCGGLLSKQLKNIELGI